MRKALLALATMCASAVSHAATLSVYLSAPGIQSTFLTGRTGLITETFDSLNVRPGQQQTMHSYTAPSGIGTYTMSGKTSARFEVQDADQFGGADGSQFMSFGSQTGYANPVSLTLPSSYNYFGFWWSAGDENNGISLYNDNNLLLGRFSTADIMSVLKKGTTVTSLDNVSRYMADEYYGNPNPAFAGQDADEVFTYVSIITTGVTFNKIVLDNSGLTNSGFENDNHSVYLGDLDMRATCGACVFVETVTAGTPEPGTATYGMVGSSAIAVSMLLKRLQKRRPRLRTSVQPASAGR